MLTQNLKEKLDEKTGKSRNGFCLSGGGVHAVRGLVILKIQNDTAYPISGKNCSYNCLQLKPPLPRHNVRAGAKTSWPFCSDHGDNWVCKHFSLITMSPITWCMCVCMYVYMYICLNVCMYVYMYICEYTFRDTKYISSSTMWMYVCMYVRMYV